MPDPARGFVPMGDELVSRWAMFSLVRRTVRAPDGSIFDRTHVVSPGAVGVVALTSDHRVVLVEQFRSALGRFTVEIPAGMKDVPGEDSVTTAARELAEETGVRAENFQLLGIVHSAPGVTDSEVEVYLAHVVAEGSPSPHGPEETHMTRDLVPLGEAVHRVLRGEITDSKTVFGLLAAERVVSRGL